jgi:DNA-directed RNA polymerase specialized sigma24 family protein
MNLSDIIAEENADKKIEIEEAVNRLGHIDRAVLYLWVTGYTQAEIGVMFGYSERHIRRILANIREKCPKSS